MVVKKLKDFSQGELGYLLSTQRRSFDSIFTALQTEVVTTLKSKAVASVNPRNQPKETIKILLEMVTAFIGEAAGRLEDACVSSWDLAIRDYHDRLASTSGRVLAGWADSMREEIAQKAGYATAQNEKKIELVRTASQKVKSTPKHLAVLLKLPGIAIVVLFWLDFQIQHCPHDTTQEKQKMTDHLMPLPPPPSLLPPLVAVADCRSSKRSGKPR